jgi:hypothetical protein
MNSEWMKRLGAARAWVFAAVVVAIAIFLLIRR